MEYYVRILETSRVARNVKYIRTEKPKGYNFTPGQATEVSINSKEWRNEKRPFTFTSLNDDAYLEFTIKSYHDHHGVTSEMDTLQAGDELIIGEAWGAIEYKGPGYFIAGGAGITPFISIFRNLHRKKQLKGNCLFFSNHTKEDIIYENELIELIGKENIMFTLTGEDRYGYDHRLINIEFLRQNIKDSDRHFYICGPDVMTKQVTEILLASGISAEEVVLEK